MDWAYGEWVMGHFRLKSEQWRGAPTFDRHKLGMQRPVVSLLMDCCAVLFLLSVGVQRVVDSSAFFLRGREATLGEDRAW